MLSNLQNGVRKAFYLSIYWSTLKASINCHVTRPFLDSLCYLSAPFGVQASRIKNFWLRCHLFYANHVCIFYCINYFFLSNFISTITILMSAFYGEWTYSLLRVQSLHVFDTISQQYVTHNITWSTTWFYVTRILGNLELDTWRPQRFVDSKHRYIANTIQAITLT